MADQSDVSVVFGVFQISRRQERMVHFLLACFCLLRVCQALQLFPLVYPGLPALSREFPRSCFLQQAPDRVEVVLWYFQPVWYLIFHSLLLRRRLSPAFHFHQWEVVATTPLEILRTVVRARHWQMAAEACPLRQAGALVLDFP